MNLTKNSWTILLFIIIFLVHETTTAGIKSHKFKKETLLPMQNLHKDRVELHREPANLHASRYLVQGAGQAGPYVGDGSNDGDYRRYGDSDGGSDTHNDGENHNDGGSSDSSKNASKSSTMDPTVLKIVVGTVCSVLALILAPLIYLCIKRCCCNDRQVNSCRNCEDNLDDTRTRTSNNNNNAPRTVVHFDAQSRSNSNLNNPTPSGTCSICLCASCDTCLQCAHSFHNACILQWLTKDNKCPLCRTQVPRADVAALKRRAKSVKSAPV